MLGSAAFTAMFAREALRRPLFVPVRLGGRRDARPGFFTSTRLQASALRITVHWEPLGLIFQLYLFSCAACGGGFAANEIPIGSAAR
jgi:hypothetical protein